MFPRRNQFPAPRLSFKVMLHWTIRNDDFQLNTTLQCWNSVAAISNNVATMLQRCVALKIVVSNRPVQHYLYSASWYLRFFSSTCMTHESGVIFFDLTWSDQLNFQSWQQYLTSSLNWMWSFWTSNFLNTSIRDKS